MYGNVLSICLHDIDEITTLTRMASNVYVFLVVGSFHKIKVVVVNKQN